MAMKRGEIWWAELDEPQVSEPGYMRPVVIVQDDAFNRSRINTVIAVVITSNLKLAAAPGNVPLPTTESGLAKDSVVNVSQIITLDKSCLTERAGSVARKTLLGIERGLLLVLGISMD